MATTPTKHAKTPPKNFFFKKQRKSRKKGRRFFSFQKSRFVSFFQKDSTKLVIFFTNFTIYPKFGFSFQ